MSEYNVGAYHVEDMDEKEVRKLAKSLLNLKCKEVTELVKAAENDICTFSPFLIDDTIHWLRLNAYNRKKWSIFYNHRKKKYIKVIRKLRFFRCQSAENLPRCIRMPGTKVNEVNVGDMVVFFKDNGAGQPRFYYGEVTGLDSQEKGVVVKFRSENEMVEQVIEPLRLVVTYKECSFFSGSPSTLPAWLGLYFALRNRFFSSGMSIVRHDAWSTIGAMCDEMAERAKASEAELATAAEG